MDTLKSLMDKHEFELVIKLTEKSNDVDSIFYRISALLGIGKPEEALNTLKEHHNLLRKNLYLLIKVHMDLLIILGRFDEAYEELDYYKNLPYESQQVEELLSSMVGHIRSEEKQAYKHVSVSDDEVKSRLLSNDQVSVISALGMVGERGVIGFINEVQKVMVNFPLQNVRTYALLLLVSKKVDGEFNFKSGTGIISVNPSKIKPPFVGNPFNRICNRMISEFRNPTISDNAIEIFSQYIMDIYPEEVKDSDEDVIAALYVLSCEILQIKDSIPLDKYCESHNAILENSKKLFEKFKNLLEKL
ncbi:MAG: hypothetical protein MJZ37_03880 [Bacilli bacterium]|nr:hypothetical protein [Bacilli bacterium]